MFEYTAKNSYRHFPCYAPNTAGHPQWVKNIVETIIRKQVMLYTAQLNDFTLLTFLTMSFIVLCLRNFIICHRIQFDRT